MTEEDQEIGGKNITEYATYEDFLDSQITETDRFYLDDITMARALVELGYRGNRVGSTKEQFLKTKEAIDLKKLEARTLMRTVISAGQQYPEDAMLRALQQREEANRTGKQSSIIMVRDFNELGQEISGYIDYSHRLATEDFREVFSGRRRLLPTITDLSFYNWDSTKVYTNNSPTYDLIASSPKGMSFLNKRDGKIVYVDPDCSPGDNSSRTLVPAEHYQSVIIFDHYNRRRI